MSEASKTRHIVLPYCQDRNGADLGSGGDPIVEWAIQFDKGRRGHLSDRPIHWVGDVFKDGLPFKDNTLGFLYGSHILEDTLDWEPVLREWARVIKPGGYLIIQVPDKERFREAVASGRNTPNLSHQHESYPGELSIYMGKIGGFEVIWDWYEPKDDYNILAVFKKL